MITKIYHRKVTCDYCNKELRYETEDKKELPTGWIKQRRIGNYSYNSQEYHYCSDSCNTKHEKVLCV